MKPKDGYSQCPCCEKCNDCDAGFQKILDLKKTGLVIYRHISCSDDVTNFTGIIQFSAKTTEDVFILHNTKNIDITSADYLPEIEINAIPCPRCRKVVENAQKLLEKVPAITRNDVKGICEHCRMKATPCIECKEIVKKFVADRTERAENTKQKVKTWISKVKGLLKDSASEMGKEIVRAHSELHIDELCRDTVKSEREPVVKQMFRDSSDFVGAFPPSIDKRKTMFAHSEPPEKPKHPVAFKDQPEILGIPSTSRLDPEFNVQDHDIGGYYSEGYYSDVDSEDMRTMFHPALTEEEKQRKSNKEHIPKVPFPSEKDFISAKDNDIISFENVIRQKSPNSHQFHKEYMDNMQDFAESDKVSYKKELSHQILLKDYSDSKRDITPTKLNNSRESPDLIRRVHSEESLLSRDAIVTKDFSFVFPKKLSPDIKKLKRQKSSSELIQNTRDMLAAKAEEEKNKREEEKKKLEEEQMKKLEEEEKKRKEEEQMRKLAEDENKRIEREKRRKELAMIKADEENRRLKVQILDEEYVGETITDTHKKETVKIDEIKQQGFITPTKEKYTKIAMDNDDGLKIEEKASDKDKKVTTFAKGEIENQHKLKEATTKEVKYNSDTGEKAPDKTDKQKDEKITLQQTMKETDTMDKGRKDGADKQNTDKSILQKKVETKGVVEYKVTKNIHDKETISTKDVSIVKVKEKQKESQPKDTKELQETKERKGPLELKEQKTSNEPKEILESKSMKESKELKEVKKLTEPKELETLKKQKGPKVAKDQLLQKSPKEPKESKELRDYKEAKEPKELKELKDSKESKEPTADKKALKADKNHEKFKKGIESKLQKEEKENLKKEKEEQLRIEKENKEKEKEFNKRGKTEPAEVKGKDVKSKKTKGDTAAKQKDKTKQEKLVTDETDKASEVPPTVQVKIEKIKARRLSPDDLILRLVKLKQSTKQERIRTQRLSDMVSGKGVKVYQRQHVADANDMCTASDIDFEAEALAFSKKNKEKPEVIIGDKIFVFKKPPMTLRQEALIEMKEKEIRRQEICEIARQKKLKQEMEEAAAKKQRQEDKAKIDKAEMEGKDKNETGLSYLKNVNFNAIKVRRPSPDDLILQLVRLKQSRSRAEKAKPKRLADTKLDKKEVRIHKPRKPSARLTAKESESELESERTNELNKKEQFTEIIIGKKISKYKPSTGDRQNVLSAPSFLQSTFDTNQEPVQAKRVESSEHITGKHADHELAKGVIRYALSDRTFIEKGWTMLPTEKIVRKMNVYRMRPAHPEFDWFEHNKNKGMMQYDTGEKLAEFDDEGRGRWFYRNGRMALDYYDAEELNAQQRFVIYSSGEPDERGRAQPYTLLATFDYLGNGVVFDHSGKIRLKYNQTEGVVLDRSIGPVSHWKWHTLNDPPVLQQVMIDTQMAHKDPSIVKLGGALDERVPRPDNDDMLAIEFDNFIKEKSKKLTQTFKPFQIKMKALKINEHFSLRVLDQATIYLLFRDGTTNLKLNMGMVLDHKEIVDTDTAEVGEVSTNMERLPARTDSLARLQRSVAHAQRYERMRTDRELKIRPTMPRSSVDKLVSAASQPMRAPLRLGKSASTTTTDSYCKCSRKPTSSNIYYDTRLC